MSSRRRLRQGKMPGIQVNAAIADDILSNRFLTEGGARSRVAVVVASALVIGVVSVLLPAWWASAVAAVAIVVLGWIATRLFAAGYWLNLSQPVARVVGGAVRRCRVSVLR